MAKKLTLSKRPESFKKAVKIPLVDGTEADVEFTFKYRTRTEFAKLFDESAEAAKKQESTEQDAPSEPMKLSDYVGKSVEDDAEYIMKIAEGWDLEDDFGSEAVFMLIDMYPGASKRIAEAYADAINGARSGN